MFSRFTNALFNAVDALAPPLPLQEDFVWHWKAVTKFYTGKNASNKVPIEATRIPGHLLEMLAILEQEEKEMEVGSIGPCMEYIMQHKLLDTMCILGTADAPPGMKRFMLIFITRMLRTTQQFLIPHVSIYMPIQKFIQLCGEVLAAPTEKEEIDFLEVICDKLKENPHLVNCFLGPFSENSRKNSVQDDSLKAQSSALQASNKEYTLISSLLKLFQSPDNSISARSGDCLKSCCSLASDTAAMTIVQCTDLSHTMCHCIVILYNSLSKTMKLSDLEDPMQSGTDEDGNSSQMSADKRKFLCYLQHLNFIDTIVQEAHPVIADSLASKFKSIFLDSYIYPELVTNTSQDDVLFATTLISSSMRHITSSKLMSSFGVFLLGESDNFEVGEHTSHVVKDLLIERCRNSKDDLALSMATLQLFEELLQNPTELILNNLVISNLESRDYYDLTAADSWLAYSDDESSDKYDDDDIPSGSSPISKTFAPSYIHRILDCFLSLMPDEIKSCESEEESGYDTYIKEAHGRFVKCLMVCENFDWPQDPLCKEEYHLGPEDDSSSDSQPEADSSRWDFYEGAFLSMIFDKLEQMLDQPYDINLQVTSLVSKLALFAHPNLHEYLLNPLIPYTSGTRSLFTVLFRVVEDVQKEVQGIKTFKKKLQLTRNALLSDGNEFATFEESKVLEVLIVLEEFCKELAAITFVKYHAAS